MTITQSAIILGDFNLHHPLWAGPQSPAAHGAAEDLLSAISGDYELLTPLGTVTYPTT